jgi:hypothetical protein
MKQTSPLFVVNIDCILNYLAHTASSDYHHLKGVIPLLQQKQKRMKILYYS